MTIIVDPPRWREGLREALAPRLHAGGVSRWIAALAAVAVLAGVVVGVPADSNTAVRNGRPAETGIVADAAFSAALRQVDRVWRLMLQTRSDSCPSAALLAPVRSMLASCVNAPANQ